ncbi:hypothetical protein Hanom_Chr11g00992571 [Helianthus anomalus]
MEIKQRVVLSTPPLITFYTPLLSHTYRWGPRGTGSFPLTGGHNQEEGGCV